MEGILGNVTLTCINQSIDHISSIFRDASYL